ncbi:MAG: flagellar basal-body MS-ring/collar protein FliF [Bryobacteraceae bacterium]|nr:flagellar basal-body MS-ring/collar protein FliF [Bryobacteraceae bacterium]MDW8376753.1 flagellar basal-body MS-ring/collar protein FliF [Bryobacterales bacterium]
MLNQLKLLVANLSRRQIAILASVTALMVGGLSFLILRNRDRDYQPVYRGLAPEDAAQIVEKLKESNVEYRLADNGATILVHSARVAEIRLLLAGNGLPKSGRLGFELFDKTNFGATDFAEQVNYRRALEGELERSIASLQEVEQARVHLTFAKDSVFTESRQPAKASVLLKLKSGAELSRKNVQAIEHLVANAVQGLHPENVSIVDMRGNLLSRHRLGGGSEEEYKQHYLEYRQKMEKALLANIYSTLEPVLGADHFRAGVSVEVDFSSGEQSEETFDPDRSVMVSQQRSEETSAPQLPSGVPGTASSLPRPTSRPGSSSSTVSRRTENISYQTSRTVRRTKFPDGTIRRISVSAILDQNVRWEGTGSKARRILEPPSEETLKKVRDLIAGAVGYNPERGDQIFVQSLPFESTLKANPAPADSGVGGKPAAGATPLGRWLAERHFAPEQQTLVVLGAALVLLLLAGGAFSLWRQRRKSRAVAAVDLAQELPPGPGPLPAVPAADDSRQTLQAAPGEVAALSEAKKEDADARAEAELLRSIRPPELTTKKAEVLLKHITEQAKREPATTAQLLRSWLAEKDRR